jgi:hypothetical protein
MEVHWLIFELELELPHTIHKLDLGLTDWM